MDVNKNMRFHFSSNQLGFWDALLEIKIFFGRDENHSCFYLLGDVEVGWFCLVVGKCRTGSCFLTGFSSMFFWGGCDGGGRGEEDVGLK